MKQHFDPFVDAYDLSNLNMREFYCKMLVRGQIKDPMSLRTVYNPDAKIYREGIEYLYECSRRRYARTLEETRRIVEQEQSDVIEKIENFGEPII